jgi:hypothetical protein
MIVVRASVLRKSRVHNDDRGRYREYWFRPLGSLETAQSD